MKWIIFFVLLSSGSVLAQTKNDEQIEFALSNDKFIFRDRYFTNGIYITYKKNIEKDFIFKKSNKHKLQLNITLANEAYTPKSLSSFSNTEFDRPFAGWLSATIEINKIKETSLFALALESGVTGKASQAGNLQVWVHRALSIDDLPTWVDEIDFKVLFNLKSTYIKNWNPNPENTFTYNMVSVIGTKDIFIENSFNYAFGKQNAFYNSSKIGALDNSNSNEFFGVLTAGYRYVIHNTLIQGSIINNKDEFTTKAENHILKLALGGVLKHKRNTFKLIYNFNTKETPLATSHIYGTFVYSRNF